MGARAACCTKRFADALAFGGNDQRHQVDYKKMRELSDRFGFSVRDIQRHLKKLCTGWLKREQLEVTIQAPVLVHQPVTSAIYQGQTLSGSRASRARGDKPSGSFLSSRKNKQEAGGTPLKSRSRRAAVCNPER